MKIGPTALIRARLRSIPMDRPFSTRDFLAYGLRNSVDKALHRMVKNKELIRLTGGIFIKWVLRPKWPSAKEVAAAKAKAFGKELLTHGSDAAQLLGLSTEKSAQPTFATLGRTTSFSFSGTRIHLKSLTPRDAKLLDTVPGLAIRAIRQIGRKSDVRRNLASAMLNLGQLDRLAMWDACWSMPAWMSNALVQLKN